MSSPDQLVEQLFVEAGTVPAGDALTSALDFTAPVAQLRLILERLNMVVSARDVMPVLKHVRIEATGGDRLVLTATDMELVLRSTTTRAFIRTPGTAVVPARRLLEILRTLWEDSDVRVGVVGGAMTVSSGPTRWTVQVPTGADFPNLVTIGEGIEVTVEVDDLIAAIERVRYAAAPVDQAALAALLIDSREMSACDGARFAATAIPFALPHPIVLPVAAADRVFKLARTTLVEQMTIGEIGRYISMRIGDNEFFVAKPAHPYPDMKATMLRPVLANRRELVVDRDEVKNALRRVAVTTDSDKGIALHLSRNALVLAARDGQRNETSHELAAGWSGRERVLAVNLTHLTDLVRHHGTRQLSLWLGEDSATRRNPILVRDQVTGTVGVIPQMHLPWAS